MPLKWHHYSIQAQRPVHYNFLRLIMIQMQLPAVGVELMLLRRLWVLELLQLWPRFVKLLTRNTLQCIHQMTMHHQMVHLSQAKLYHLRLLWWYHPSTALGANANQSPSSSSSLKLALISKLERRSGAVNDTPASALQCIQQELVSYLSPLSLTEEEKICPLSFWAKHSEYPYVSKVAKYYLTASALSVPVECMFSVTGIIDNAKHSRLDPYELNQLSFTHDNYSKFFQVKKVNNQYWNSQ